MPRVEIIYDFDDSSATINKDSNYKIISHHDCHQSDCCEHDHDDEDDNKMTRQLSRNRKSMVVVPDTYAPCPRAKQKNLLQSTPEVAGFNTRRTSQKQTGKLFEDPDFSTVESSIFKTRPASKYQWKRPKDICRDPQFVSDGISRFDVRQGELGNCWILAAVASLSLNSKLFEQVVPIDQNFGKDYCGMFRFKLWQFGNWVDVVVDDRLPTYKGKLVFMHSTDKNEFWSALLEKAFAKLNGSYEALSGGNQSEAMEDFTGGLCETFSFRDPFNTELKMLQLAQQADKANSLMGCSVEAEEESQIESIMKNGLIQGHAYSVTGIADVDLTNRKVVTLIRLRNPWGNEAEWTGQWGDGDKENWSKVSEQEKSRIGFTTNDDGEFWMQFSDFYNEFTKLEVCHLGPATMGSGASDPAHMGKKRKWEECLEVGSWKKNISAGGCRNYIKSFHMNPQFRVEIVDPDEDSKEKKGTIIVGLMQKNVRKLHMGEYFTIGYTLYKIDDPKCGPLDESFFRFTKSADRSPNYINQREICGRHTLPPGHYVIIPTTFDPNEEADFILRIFSEKPYISETLDASNKIEEVKPSESVKQIKKDIQNEDDSGLKKAFMKFAGESEKINAKQLQRILNVSFSKGVHNFEGFSLESCRSMLALVDYDLNGNMEYGEFKILWDQLRFLKTVFKDHDEEGCGTFTGFELRAALKHTGYIVSNKLLETIARRYTDDDLGTVSFEDYILLSIRLKIAFETYDAMPEISDNSREVNRDHFLLHTIYL